MSEPRSTRAILACFAAFVALTAFDLWTKAWAERTLSRERTVEIAPVCTADSQGNYYSQRARTEPIVLVPNHLEFRYAENCGAAFGLFDRAPRWLRVGIFMTAGALAIIALAWMFMRGSGGVLFAVAVPLVTSGAAGNMVDRFRLGYVVDFIHFHIPDVLDYPTFNVADSTITIGVALLLLDGMRKPSPRPEPAAEQAGAGST